MSALICIVVLALGGFAKSVPAQESLPLVGEHLDYFGPRWSLTLDSVYCILATEYQGTVIYNVSDLENPEFVAYAFPLPLGSMTIWHGMLCGLSSGYLYFIDISNIEEPRVITSLNGGVYCLTDTLCIISTMDYDYIDPYEIYIYSSLTILDVSDINNPNVLFQYFFDSHTPRGPDVGFRTMAYYNGYLYTGHWNFSDVSIWDVRDPTSLIAVRNLGVCAPYWLIINDDRLLAFDNSYFSAFSLDEPENTELLITVDSLRLTGMTIKDDLLYMVESDSSFSILDIGDMVNVEYVGHLGLNSVPNGIAVDQGIGVVTFGDCSVSVLDLADPDNMSVAATMGRPGTIKRVLKSNNLLFTLVNEIGLLISDCYTPEHPQELSCIPSQSCREIAVSDSFIYIPIIEEGVVYIYDISDPSNPQFISTFNPELHFLYSVAIVDNALYIGGYNGLKVYDISDPGSPRFISCLFNSSSYDLQIAGSLLACRGINLVYFFNIQNPLEPQALQPYQIQRQDLLNKPTQFTVVQDKAFIKVKWGETEHSEFYLFDIIDVSENDSARLLGTLYGDEFPVRCHAFFPIGSKLGVITGNELAIYSFDEYPERPFNLVNRYKLQSFNTIEAFLDEGYLFTVTPGQILIYDGTPLSICERTINTPSTLSLSPPYPNPFNQTTLISFSIPRASPISISIYDPLGRRIQTYHPSGLYGGGQQRFLFDGGGFPTGSYFIRITAGDEVAMGKVTKVD